MLAVVDNMLTLCVANRAMTARMLKKDCTEYHGGPTIDGDKRKRSLVTVSITTWNLIGDKSAG